MSALDDLVAAVQAAVSATEHAHSAAAEAGGPAAEAVEAAAALGRSDDIAAADALRSDLEEQVAALAAAEQALDELLQRAVALQGGG